jgi:hypothetical protein
MLERYFPEEYAQQQRAQNVYKGDVTDMSLPEKLFTGYAQSINKSAAGIMDLLPGGVPQKTQERFRDWDALTEEAGGWGTAGQFATDAASLGMGAAGLTKGVMSTGVPLLKSRFVAAPLAEAVVGGATTAENRGRNALFGAAGGTGGELLTRAVTGPGGGAFRGLTTPEAQTMMSQGVPVPVWRAVKPGVTRSIMERARTMPLTGSVMRALDRNALEKWNKNIFDYATPPRPRKMPDGTFKWEANPVSSIGTDGMAQLSRRFDEAYDAVLGRGGSAIRVDATAAASARNQLNQHARQMMVEYPNYSKEIEGVMAMTARRMPEGEDLPMAALKDLLDDLDVRSGSAAKQGKGDLVGVYATMRGSLEDFRMDLLPPNMREALAPVNAAYANYKVLQRTMAQRGANKAQLFTPAQLDAGIRASDRSPSKRLYSEGRSSQLTQDQKIAGEVFDSNLPETGPGTAEKLLPFMMAGQGIGAAGALAAGDMGTTALLATPQGHRFLMGGYGPQAAVRAIAPTLTTTGRAVGFAGALDRDEELPLDVPRYQGYRQGQPVR